MIRARDHLATLLTLAAVVLTVGTSTSPASAEFVLGSFLLYDPMTIGASDIPDTRFGRVIATGDFDGDGAIDMAVGTPDRDTAGVSKAGAVFVMYGADGGLDAASTQTWTRSALAIPGSPGVDDQLGHALAVGDFDADGYDDLAIGMPGATAEGFQAAGSVVVLYGSASGLVGSGSEFLDQTDFSGTNPEMGDFFGEALAAGDFNADGHDDLAVGSSYETWVDNEEAGVVQIVHGDGDGLVGNATQHYIAPGYAVGGRFAARLAAGDVADDEADDLVVTALGADGYRGVVHVMTGNAGVSFVRLDRVDGYSVKDCDYIGGGFDLFGFALAVANFDGRGREDIAIGSPGGWGTRGFVCLLLGDDDGVDMPFITVTVATGGAPVSASDAAGSALAAGDFDHDGRADLAMGVPGYDVQEEDSGLAVVFWGDAGDPLSARPPNYFLQDTNEYPETPEIDDRLGRGMGAGDFDGDGVDDLAIGVPGDTGEDGSVVTFRGGRFVLFTDGFESGDTSRWE